MIDNEQWKSDGICGKCRRADYCKRDCSALKRRRQSIINKAYADVLGTLAKKEGMEDETISSES